MRLLLMIPITALCLGTAHAQNTSKEAKPAMEQAPLKDHMCTAACKDGQHMYAHGEKGHACTADCMKMHAGEAMMKDHVCTAMCKDGKHMYAHGEKGHVCDPSCKHHKAKRD